QLPPRAAPRGRARRRVDALPEPGRERGPPEDTGARDRRTARGAPRRGPRARGCGRSHAAGRDVLARRRRRLRGARMERRAVLRDLRSHGGPRRDDALRPHPGAVPRRVRRPARRFRRRGDRMSTPNLSDAELVAGYAPLVVDRDTARYYRGWLAR